jgi:plasmid stabilization system protein ParE
MRITFDPRAAEELASQIEYLIQQNALLAAARLKTRCDAFFASFLALHPRTGKHIADKDIWETWIPGTRLIVWYRFTSDALQIIRIWHSAQDREQG